MASRGLDALVVTSEACIHYLTGYGGRSAYTPQCVVVTANGVDPQIVLRDQDVACAHHSVFMDEARIHALPETYIGVPERSGWTFIADRLRAFGLARSRLGLDGDSFDQRRVLSAELPGATLIEAGLLIDRVRGIKSDSEIT